MTYIRKKKLTSLKKGLFSIIWSLQFSRIAGNNVKIFKTQVELRAADEWLHRANFRTFWRSIYVVAVDQLAGDSLFIVECSTNISPYVHVRIVKCNQI